jgi:AraC-like DNA-binding protein
MKDVGYSVMIFDMLWAALEAQRSNPLNAVDASPTPLVKCLDYIENNLHRNISLADLMKSSALGASRLTQLFRENLGAPPLHYVAKRKMDIAERLIASSGASISEIAARLGFKSLSYFSRVFKRVKGEAPSEIIAKK